MTHRCHECPEIASRRMCGIWLCHMCRELLRVKYIEALSKPYPGWSEQSPTPLGNETGGYDHYA